jgi:DNA-binding transcriptional ArsR family regulator
MRMMDIREKILTTLDRKPGDTFSVSQIARAIGSTPKATNATLSRLFKAGLIARPQKGVYSGTVRSSAKAAASEPVKPRKVAKRAKIAEPVAAPITPLSVMTIDLLIEGEQSKIDVDRILEKIREERAVLDTRVRKVTEADQSKLQIRFTLAD